MELIHRVQRLALWYIEAASDICFNSKWKALLLYQVPSTSVDGFHSLAGYVTLKIAIKQKEVGSQDWYQSSWLAELNVHF